MWHSYNLNPWELTHKNDIHNSINFSTDYFSEFNATPKAHADNRIR